MAQQMLASSSGPYFFFFFWSGRSVRQAEVQRANTVGKPWTFSSYNVPVGPAPLLTFEYHVRFQEGPRKKADVAPWRAVYWPGGNIGATRATDSPIIPQSQIWVDFFFFLNRVAVNFIRERRWHVQKVIITPVFKEWCCFKKKIDERTLPRNAIMSLPFNPKQFAQM